MTIIYSATTGGFYDTALHGEPGGIDCKIPADGVEVPAEQYAELMAGQPSGKVIIADNDGRPMLSDPPAESQADALARALVDIRKQRAPILSTLDGIAGRTFRAGDTGTAQAADVAIVALLDITKLPALLAAETYDEMKAAVLERYRQIAGAAPAAIQSAFIEAIAP